MAKGRPRSFDRDKALTRATMAFWKHGYDATSVAHLTEAMGIGAPSMYAAFGDKRALFEEALVHYMKTYGSFMGRLFDERFEDQSMRAAIAQLLRDAAAMFTSSDHPRGCMLITAATNCAPESAPVAKRLRELRASTVQASRPASRVRSHVESCLQTWMHARWRSTSRLSFRGCRHKHETGPREPKLEAIVETAMRAWPRPRRTTR